MLCRWGLCTIIGDRDDVCTTLCFHGSGTWQYSSRYCLVIFVNSAGESDLPPYPIDIRRAMTANTVRLVTETRTPGEVRLSTTVARQGTAWF